MKIAAYLGNSANAPSNCRLALASAWCGGAEMLHFVVRLCGSGRLVLAVDADTRAATGTPGKVAELSVSALRKLDYSNGFIPRGVVQGDPTFDYIDANVADRRHPIDVFDEVIDDLPQEPDWCIELRSDPGDPSRDAAAAAALAALINPRRYGRRIVLTADTDALFAELRAVCPLARFAARPGLLQADRTELAIFDAAALWASGSFTAKAAVVRGEVESGKWTEGAYLIVRGRVDPALLAAAQGADWIAALGVESLFDCASLRPMFTMIDEPFKGQTPNKSSFSLGYAKANKFARVSWDEGIHIDIAPYDGDLPEFSGDDVHRRLERLRWDLINVGRDWPFYSGGGLGVMHGISGDFAAEVDYRVAEVGQATTLEMAVTNVDPGTHRDNPPSSFREKCSFFDPHGAPPFVGVEHDENDGYRINWNLGTEYDNNQYGRPAGDGRTPRGARLRLERRGNWFAAYYRDPVDSAGQALPPHDWICVGVTRNLSLNHTVYLRCVGKRWRQEKASDPSLYEPIIANRFTFQNLHIACFPQDPGD